MKAGCGLQPAPLKVWRTHPKIVCHDPLSDGESIGNAGTDDTSRRNRRIELHMRTHQDAKAMAKAMRSALAEREVTISHSEALEIVARQFGLANWNILSAQIDTERGIAPSAESDIRFEQAVPIIRIFDVAKAHEFYLGFLGFTVDWEHRYGENFPLYTQISRAGLRLHLSEHAGDATPGGNMVVYMHGAEAFQRELTGKHYRYMKPGLERVEDRLEVTVIDPFGNRIRFMEIQRRPDSTG